MRLDMLLAVACTSLVAAACQGTIDGAVGGPGQDGRAMPTGASSSTGASTTGGSGTTGGAGGSGPGVTVKDTATRVALRRLTRTQYDNSVRDLLGIDTHPATDFGIDEDDGGFASNDRAPVEALQVERYQTAAEALAQKAIANLTALVPCAPPNGAEATCLDDFLRTFGKRAYRRPLTADETAAYTQLFAAGKIGSDFAGGISLVVSTMLQSPHFLYRPELGVPAASTAEGWPLTPYETASRLSYFLQNTTPDDDLLAAADANKLVTADEIAAQARRLLAAPKGRDTVIAFHQQWLEVDGLPALEKDARAYPAFTNDLRTAMVDEVREFTDHVLRQGDGKLATLLTANFSFVRGPLYALYGLPAPGAGAATPARVTLPAAERAGLFTLASVMAQHGHPDQSSPVKRGYVILDKLLCTVPPPPPPNVNNMVPKPDPNVSTRERFAQHRNNASCAACHNLMDPLGIAFEIYDGIGGYRKTDGNRPVDATSELMGTDRDGPVKDAVDLMSRMATATEVRACIAKQWFRYAFGRFETADDAGIVATALDGFVRSDYRIPDLMVALASTQGFRHRLPIRP